MLAFIHLSIPILILHFIKSMIKFWSLNYADVQHILLKPLIRARVLQHGDCPNKGKKLSPLLVR